MHYTSILHSTLYIILNLVVYKFPTFYLNISFNILISFATVCQHIIIQYQYTIFVSISVLQYISVIQ